MGVLVLSVRRPFDKVTILPVEFLPAAQVLYLLRFLSLRKINFENDNIIFLRDAPDVGDLRVNVGILANFTC